jgi:hypothetical protein
MYTWKCHITFTGGWRARGGREKRWFDLRTVVLPICKRGFENSYRHLDLHEVQVSVANPNFKALSKRSQLPRVGYERCTFMLSVVFEDRNVRPVQTAPAKSISPNKIKAGLIKRNSTKAVKKTITDVRV